MVGERWYSMVVVTLVIIVVGLVTDFMDGDMVMVAERWYAMVVATLVIVVVPWHSHTPSW
jgi:hypothetical protein